jgi:hypothetical protein
MTTAHELLSSRKWQGLRLAELIERELEPYRTAGNVSVDGPDVVLHAEAGQAVAMAVHELVTNAAKYGALSVEGGRVSVRWAYADGTSRDAGLVLDWTESGGPPVEPGARPGYGTSVIRDLIPYELDGAADLQLAPEGVRCRLTIARRWLEGGAPPAVANRASAVGESEMRRIQNAANREADPRLPTPDGRVRASPGRSRGRRADRRARPARRWPW